jgi:hypothetical protein
MDCGETIRLFRIMSIPTTFRLFLVLTYYFICIKDFNAETNTSLKLNLFSFFLSGCQHHQRKTICLYVYISDIRQIVGYRTPVFIQRFPWRLHNFLSMDCGETIRLFRIMSIPTTFRLFLVLTSEQIGRRLPVFTLLLWQRQHIIVVDVQCTQQKLQSICAVLTFDPQLKKILTFAVKDRYQWCSVPHYLSDIRNIYINADRFPLMVLTAANKDNNETILHQTLNELESCKHLSILRIRTPIRLSITNTVSGLQLTTRHIQFLYIFLHDLWQYWPPLETQSPPETACAYTSPLF